MGKAGLFWLIKLVFVVEFNKTRRPLTINPNPHCSKPKPYSRLRAEMRDDYLHSTLGWARERGAFSKNLLNKHFLYEKRLTQKRLLRYFASLSWLKKNILLKFLSVSSEIRVERQSVYWSRSRQKPSILLEPEPWRDLATASTARTAMAPFRTLMERYFCFNDSKVSNLRHFPCTFIVQLFQSYRFNKKNIFHIYYTFGSF
jgi:hypothetical protein